jgi:uncharacterized membrane protein
MPVQEEIKVAADKLKDTLKEVIRQGNVTRVVVRNADGRTLIDMPIAAGVVGAVLAPFWMAVAGIVMLAKEFTVVIERHDGAVTKTD